MRIRYLLVVLVLGSLLMIGCGGDQSEEPAPDLGELIISSAIAVSAQEDIKLHYVIDTKVKAELSADASPQANLLLGAPLALRIEGDSSKDALTADGALRLGGKTYDAEFLSNATETYLKLVGTWYGDPTKGLDQNKDRPEQVSPAKARQALALIQANANEVFDAEVTAGPDIEGDTWQARGRCNPEGIFAVSQRNGKPVSAQEREQLRVFCQAVEITYVVGAEDRLPRMLNLNIDLTKDEIARLDEPAAAQEINAVNMNLNVKTTKWGESISFDAPSEYRPLDEAAEVLLSLLLTIAPKQDSAVPAPGGSAPAVPAPGGSAPGEFGEDSPEGTLPGRNASTRTYAE